MPVTFHILFLLIAVVIFALATFWGPPRYNLLAAGLFFLTLAFLFP